MPCRRHYYDPYELSDSFGRMNISVAPNPRWGRNYSTYQPQPSDQAFQQWISGDKDSRTLMRELGYRGGDDAVRPRPSPLPPQRKPSSPGQYQGDAPAVDLHIHIENNNIGSLSFGMDDGRAPRSR